MKKKMTTRQRAEWRKRISVLYGSVQGYEQYQESLKLIREHQTEILAALKKTLVQIRKEKENGRKL
jgi:hypothetical protein